MRLRVWHVPSPIGAMLVAAEGQWLRALDFADHEHRFDRLLRLHYGACALDRADGTGPFGAALQAYFDGDLAALERIEVRTAGTAFQREVWAALRLVPAGRTTTYGQLAKRIGRSGASRAVGLANGANPISIVVPCHRVIGADGTLTGFGGGLGRKRWLLDHERRFGATPDLFGLPFPDQARREEAVEPR